MIVFMLAVLGAVIVGGTVGIGVGLTLAGERVPYISATFDTLRDLVVRGGAHRAGKPT